MEWLRGRICFLFSDNRFSEALGDLKLKLE